LNKTAIIVAGGRGLRMGQEIPKQFLLLNNLPILMHTISAFKNADSKTNIVVALPKDHIEYWKNLCLTHNFTTEHRLVEGGETRFNSVKNALHSIENQGLVAIHDGVRPLISTELINRAFDEAEKNGNAIPCCDMNDSMRQISDGKNFAVNRTEYKSIQTPQTFQTQLIKEAFDKAIGIFFTDDASVFEAHGNTINLIKGDDFNIKITTTKDLLIAKAIIDYKNLQK